MLSIQADHKKGWRKVVSMSAQFHLREHLPALDLECYAWAPLLHHREGNLWRFIPIYNVQPKFVQFIYIIFTVYTQPVKVSSMLGSVWVAPSAQRSEVLAVCCNTGEALNCLGMASTRPWEVPCWLWRWTWHPSGIGPLWEKHRSFDLCNFNTVLKERKKK